MDKNEKMIGYISFGYYIFAVLVLAINLLLCFTNDIMQNYFTSTIITAVLVGAIHIIIGTLLRKLSLSKKDIIVTILIVLSIIYSLECISSSIIMIKILYIIGALLNFVGLLYLYRIEKDNNVI